jgi:hypothetical protein
VKVEPFYRRVNSVDFDFSEVQINDETRWKFFQFSAIFSEFNLGYHNADRWRLFIHAYFYLERIDKVVMRELRG